MISDEFDILIRRLRDMATDTVIINRIIHTNKGRLPILLGRRQLRILRKGNPKDFIRVAEELRENETKQS